MRTAGVVQDLRVLMLIERSQPDSDVRHYTNELGFEANRARSLAVDTGRLPTA